MLATFPKKEKKRKEKNEILYYQKRTKKTKYVQNISNYIL